MAKKPTRPQRKSAPPEFDLADLPSLPDRRAMEAMLHQLSGQIGGDVDLGRIDPSLDQAQELMYEAFESDSPEARVRLAKKALKISPDCADAYVLISEQASSMQEAFELLQQGVAAGERALGPQPFAEHAGHFWGLLDTRPYMRARAGLIQCLWSFGRRTEAVEHAWDMLRLNPNDNQGLRYALASYLLELQRDDELRRLLAQFPDESGAAWPFNRALLEFRRSGDSPAAARELKRACKVNKHVSDYILGLKQLPSEMPPYITPGGETEAVTYVVDGLGSWKGTPGALAWMRKVLRAPLPDAPVRAAPSWPVLSQALARLPQVQDEVWQADIRPFSGVDDPTPQKTSPWVVLITSPAEDTILAVEMEPTRPDAKLVWEYLVGAMLKPKEGDPLRPARVEVRIKSFGTAWRKKLAEVGIDCVTCPELEHVDQVLAETISPMAARTGFGDGPTNESDFDPSDVMQFSGRVWQADIRRLPIWVGDEGEPRRPWSVLVTDLETAAVLAQEISSERPTPELLTQTVLRAIQQPMIGEPCRPGVVQVVSPDFAQALASRLEASGVEAQVCDVLEAVDFLYNDLSSRLAGPDKVAPLLEVPGIDIRQVGDYFTAAADFYQRAPWRMIPGDAVIKVECSKFQSGPWYAVVMGQSAMTYGIAIYEGLDALRATLKNDATPQGPARDTSALSLMYGEEFEIPIRDLDAIEQHGWPIAAPEAYPFLMRVNPGLVVRPPLSWELELVTACLRAVPQFVSTPRREPASFCVPTPTGELPLALSHLDQV